MKVLKLILYVVALAAIGFIVLDTWPHTTTTYSQCQPAEQPILSRWMTVLRVELADEATTISLWERTNLWSSPGKDQIAALQAVAASLAFESYQQPKLLFGSYEADRLVVTFQVHRPVRLPEAGQETILKIFGDGTVQIVYGFGLTASEVYEVCATRTPLSEKVGQRQTGIDKGWVTIIEEVQGWFPGGGR